VQFTDGTLGEPEIKYFVSPHNSTASFEECEKLNKVNIKNKQIKFYH